MVVIDINETCFDQIQKILLLITVPKMSRIITMNLVTMIGMIYIRFMTFISTVTKKKKEKIFCTFIRRQTDHRHLFLSMGGRLSTYNKRR